MGVVVEIALVTGGRVLDTQYLQIGHSDYGRIGTGQLAAGDFLADYSDRLMSLSVQRTSTRRTGPLVEYNAGTATLELRNDDGQLDPTQMLGPAPGALIRVRYVLGTIACPIFTGYIDSWLPEHRHPEFAVVTVTATDGFSRLTHINRTPISPFGAGELSGTRVARILSLVGWTFDQRSVAPGTQTLQATTHAGNPLEELRAVANAEISDLYVDADGKLVFKQRNSIVTDARSTTPQGVFGSDTASGEVPYVGTPGLSYDRDQLVNRVIASREGGTAQVAEDGDSMTRYGLHAHEEVGLPLSNDTAALSWAAFVLGRDKDPELRFTSLTIDSRLSQAALVHCVSRDLGDLITVVRRPPPIGSIIDSRPLYIRSIEHTWQSPDRWITTWGLQSADYYAGTFIIGDAAAGVIGTSPIGY